MGCVKSKRKSKHTGTYSLGKSSGKHAAFHKQIYNSVCKTYTAQMLSIAKFVFYPTQEDVDNKFLHKHLKVVTVKPACLQNVKVKPSHSLSQVAAQ